MTQKYRLKVSGYGWPKGTIVTKCAKDPARSSGLVLVESTERGTYKHGAAGPNTQPDGMWGAWVLKENLEEIVEDKPQVLPASSVPPVTIKREVLTINKIGVGQTFIVHGKPEEVYVKISNSHVFNHKRLQMHTTDANRFQRHLNLVAVELVVYDGE